MTASDGTTKNTSPPTPLVFWMLTALGFIGLVPCVLLPEWRELQSLQLTEQHERHKIEQLKKTVDREEYGLKLLQTDPAAVARLARRDLRFHNPGETMIHVPVNFAASTIDQPFSPRPVPPPAWLTKYLVHLPAMDYDAVFCEPKTRQVVLIMSLTMIALALVLFRKSPAPIPAA
jgi:cell division protein FtsB